MQNQIQGSSSGNMTTLDWKKWATKGLIVVAAAIVTYASQSLSGTNLGVYGPIVMGLITIAGDLLHRYGTDSSNTTTTQ